jgi:hypothetical protein
MKVNREQFLAAAIVMATTGSAGCGKIAEGLKNKIGASAQPEPASDTTTGGGEATGNVDTASPIGSASVAKPVAAPGKVVAVKAGATGPAKEFGVRPANEFGGPARELAGPANEFGGPSKEWPAPSKEFVGPAKELPAPAREWPAPSASTKPGWPPPPASTPRAVNPPPPSAKPPVVPPPKK